jgi:hypothetical protein
VQQAGHPQETERTEEAGREAACEFCEIGENCDFTSPPQGLAKFEVAFYGSVISAKYKFENQHAAEGDVTAVNWQ